MEIDHPINEGGVGVLVLLGLADNCGLIYPLYTYILPIIFAIIKLQGSLLRVPPKAQRMSELDPTVPGCGLPNSKNFLVKRAR